MARGMATPVDTSGADADVRAPWIADVADPVGVADLARPGMLCLLMVAAVLACTM